MVWAESGLHVSECGLGECGADHPLWIADELFLHRAANKAEDGLARFEKDVADKTIADDDIDDAVENLKAFDRPGVVDHAIDLLEECVSLVDERVSFAFFGADGEQADFGASRRRVLLWRSWSPARHCGPRFGRSIQGWRRHR